MFTGEMCWMCSGQAGPGSSQDVAQAQQGLEPFIVAIEQPGDLPMTIEQLGAIS